MRRRQYEHTAAQDEAFDAALATTLHLPTTPIDTALRERARRVTPGCMTGHLNAAYA